MTTELIGAKKDFNILYDGDTLAYWSTRYPANIQWNYDNLLLTNMDREERQAVRGLKLEFPLTPPAEFSNTPLAFYASPQPPHVTLPILSVKFLDDLAIASAYLEVHGYSQETIFDYIALLKYGSPARCQGGVFPTPLTALQIPKDALENSDVDDLSQKILKSCIVWILAHEVGHVCFRHVDYDRISRKQAQDNEMEADTFATEIFRRAGVLPAGMTLFFTVLAHFAVHRGDYANDDEWQINVAEATHPLSLERLKAMTDAFRRAPSDFVATEPFPNPSIVLRIADEIEKIARISEESSMQQFIRLRGLAASPEALAPRALDDPFAPLRTRLQSRSAEQKLDGLYERTHSRELGSGGEETLNASMLLVRKDRLVNGRFSFGLGEGKLRGTVAGNVLTYEWEFGDVRGRGELMSDPFGKLYGQWGYEDSYKGGGSWRLDQATAL